MERTDIKTGETKVMTAKIYSTKSDSTKNEVVLESTDLKELYERLKMKILENLSSFQQLGSNWRFVSVEKMVINFIDYDPTKAIHYT